MDYRQLGRSGLQVSAIGLGTNNFGISVDAKGSALVIHQALDSGINFIDTSNSYGGTLSEEYIGRALGGRRAEVIVGTKVSSRMGQGPNQAGNSRGHILNQVENSLKRLRTDYIDLYQIHWFDENTPAEETLRALDDLIHQGKVRYVGCSNFAAWQVCDAIWTSYSRNIASFVSVQDRYNVIDRGVEGELLPFCRSYGIGILPYYPLAHGFLTGKYKRGKPAAKGTRLALDDRGMFTDDHFDLLEKLQNFAFERDRSLLELAFAWLLAEPMVGSVIAGATNPGQVKANAATLGWRLSAQEYSEISSIVESG